MHQLSVRALRGVVYGIVLVGALGSCQDPFDNVPQPYTGPVVTGVFLLVRLDDLPLPQIVAPIRTLVNPQLVRDTLRMRADSTFQHRGAYREAPAGTAEVEVVVSGRFTHVDARNFSMGFFAAGLANAAGDTIRLFTSESYERGQHRWLYVKQP